MPGEERLVSYERSLRQRMDSIRVERLQADTLLKARGLMDGKDFDKAIQALESFQIEFGHRANIDELLAFAREEQTKLHGSRIVERCASEARRLIREGGLEEAARLLESGIRETSDASLSRLLEEVRKEQAANARKIEMLQKRVKLLQEHGELDEAIQLLQQQLTATPGNAPIRELLTALRAEREQKQATDKAIATAREAAQNKRFSAGLESLQAVSHAYGESAKLTRAIQELQSARAAHAQDVVAKSIESARAALLRSDPQGSLSALKGATEWLEFASAQKQADWQRIGQSVKKALEHSGPASSGDEFAKQLTEIAAAKPGKMPIWAIVAATVALLAIVIFVVLWKMQPPPPLTTAHIKIAKAPPGALVSIDSGSPSQADANGDLTVEVKPGTHQLQVTKEGFEAFTDKLEVNAGETVQDAISLTKVLPAGTSGTLSPQGNVAEFKLSVDGKNMGLHRIGVPIALAEGAHKVKYSAPDDSDSQEHTIQIAANRNQADTFFLKPAPPKPTTPGNLQAVGKLNIQTNAGAQISVDGQYKGTADSGGNYTVQGLNGGQHSVYVALDKFQSANRLVNVNAGQTETLAAQLQPIATATPAAQPVGSLSVSANSIERGQSVTLAWQVNNASSVSISEIGSVAPQGSRTVTPSKSARYELTANGTTLLAEQNVEVREPKPQQQTIVQTPVAPTGPDRAALEQGLNAYKSLFARASGKSAKDCKAVFAGAYQGKMAAWSRWCDSAKKFDVNEQCGQAGGSPEAPTLTCSESIVIYPKDGDPLPSNGQKTFRFAHNPDQSWQVSGW
jgi:tetratricopeptide (TPR) repeat protein